MKTLIKKFVPKSLLAAYHKSLAKTSDFYYRHPSGKMIVIGVTGTKGKSTTSFMIARILEEAGYKVGMTSTAMFKIGEREWINPHKMTMLGRFKLQKLLKEMVDAGCEYAIVETSSEGIAQWRHLGIEYDAAVLTNLALEHIETHGSFKKYREAKGELFKRLKMKNKKAKIQIKNKKIIIVNGDDENAEWFLKFPADEKLIYGINKFFSKLQITSYKLQENGIDFEINGIKFHTNLMGKFNLYNILAAIAVAQSQGIVLETCQQALEKITIIPGRLEPIEEGQSFKVFVDYAHNPSSFEALYEAIAVIPHTRIIHVFGATGGGRDKSKRPEMGRIAGARADIIVLTTDDPYEENPVEISKHTRSGIMNYELRIKKGELFEIMDRKEAIKKSIEIAKAGDIVLITGKGCEQKIAIGAKMLPWDDRKIAREALRGLNL